MNTHKIAVIAGDGIGPEVIAEGVKGLEEEMMPENADITLFARKMGWGGLPTTSKKDLQTHKKII